MANTKPPVAELQHRLPRWPSTHAVRFGPPWLGIALLALLAAPGCGASPAATISDPMVFTMTDLAAVAKQFKEKKSGVGLNRFFESKTSEWSGAKLRMDEFLEGRQRRSAFFQAIQTLTQLDLVVNVFKEVGKVGEVLPGGPANPAGSEKAPANPPPAAEAGGGKPPDAPPGKGLDPQLAEARKTLLEKLSDLLDVLSKDPILDSPFDTLDRASDFYAGYMIKWLHFYGDGRIWRRPGDPTPAPVDRSADGQPDRLILLALQTHVHPGNVPDCMAGVRVTVTSAAFRKGAGISGPDAADLVKVVRLHPTRTYDLDQVTFGESLTQSMALTTKAMVPTEFADFNVNAARQAMLEAEARRQFLSRVSKNVSYANASRHEFGWNFYPSNLEVERRGFLKKLLGFLFGTPREYDVTAHLEGGGRDCAAYLVVPRNLESFTCSVSYVVAGVEGGRESRTIIDGNFTVNLPPWDAAEADRKVLEDAGGQLPFRKLSGDGPTASLLNMKSREGTADYEIFKSNGVFVDADRDRLQFYANEARAPLPDQAAARKALRFDGEKGRFQISKEHWQQLKIYMVELDGSPARPEGQ